MNNITIRQGPPFNFIASMFQESFEKRVIDIYERVNLKDNMRMKLPHIEHNMFDYIKFEKPIQFTGSMVCFENEDDDYFKNNYSHLSEADLHLFSKTEMDNQITKKNYMYDDLLYEDIKAVLDFHRMSYVDLGSVNELRFFERGDFYTNLPIKQVW